MAHVFGKDIVHKVRAFAGDEPVAIQAIVNARLYADVPTDAQQADDDGSEGGFEGAAKTAWTTSDATNLIYTVTFDAVDDPDPTSLVLYERYYPVVNVRLQATEQVQALYKPILVWRVVPQFSQMDVDEDDVYTLEGEIETVLGDTETLKKVTRARERVFKRIASMELDRHRLEEIDLSEAVIYLATSLCLRDMSTEENDYAEKAAYYSGEYESIWKSLKLNYDADDDGVAEPAEVVRTIRAMWNAR